jgi:hypothetical protein
MSLENPIKIEPRHIYEYNTNIVNNNKIDCVNIDEIISEDKTSEITTFTIDLNEITDEISMQPFTFCGDRNQSIFNITLFNKPYYTGGYHYGQGYWVRFDVEIDFQNTFLNDLRVVFSENECVVLQRDDNSIEQIHHNTIDMELYPQAEGDFNFYMVDNKTDFLNKPITTNWGKCGLVRQYSSNFKKLFFVEVLYKVIENSYTYGNVFGLNRTFKFYARKTKRETKSYALNSSGQCVLTSEIPNFRARYPFTYPSNELMQEGATALNKYNSNAREPLSKCIANSLLYQFKNGKQTASMTVNCTDYYDMLGNKIIGEGVARKTLEAGDYVIPYIKADEPLARKKDGTAKIFQITSAEFTYDGVAQKHLKMVEVVE